MNFELKEEIFKIISTVSASENVDSYVIGGYVRDLVLKRDSKDIDIVVIGDGISFAKRVAKALGKNARVSVFKNFGTAQVKFKDLEIEFVGARKESYNRNSRKPIVEDGSLEDDQNRRDFTINALAISLNEATFGEFLDPFGGIPDLESKTIRTPLEPDTTFSDDPLRMMRAIRFATQLHFEIEPDTLASIKRNASRIEIISKERIIDEINKMMLSKKPSIGFLLMSETGLLQIIFPEFEKLRGAETVEGRGHKDNFYHTLQVLDNLSETTDKLYLRWGAIFHDIAKPVTKRYDKNHGWTFHNHNFIGARMLPKIFRRMKLPMNDKLKYVQKMVNLHMRPIVLAQDVVTDSAVRRLLNEAGDEIDDLMLLCEADITSKNEVKVKRYLKNFRMVRQKLIEIEEKDHVRNFQPPVSGEEIMATFKLKPCKEVGIIKQAIKDAILDGEIENEYHQAHAFMLQVGESLHLKH